jgi:hypothetical protein
MSQIIWGNLSKANKYRWISRFVRLTPAAILSMGVQEFSLLCQWILTYQRKEIIRVEIQERAVDLTLKASRDSLNQEFVRAYCGKEGIPVNALYDLQVKLSGKTFHKIYVYTLNKFTKMQKKMEDDFPILIELKEGNDFFRQYYYARRTCSEEFKFKKDVYQEPQRNLWDNLERLFLYKD